MATATLSTTIASPTFTLNWLSNNLDLAQTIPTPTFQLGMLSNSFSLDTTLTQPALTAVMNDWNVNAFIDPPTFAISMLSGAEYNISSVIPRPSLNAYLGTGTLLSLNSEIVRPHFTITASGENSYVLNSSIKKPSFSATMAGDVFYVLAKTIYGPQLVAVWNNGTRNAVTSKTYVMNMFNTAHSEYLNYEFNSYFKLNNIYYGINSTGIYKLTGDKDGSVDINTEIHLPVSSFDVQAAKACSDAIIYGRLDGDMEVSVVLDEEELRDKFYIKADDQAGLHRIRVKIPKGLKGSTWQFRLKNYYGSQFSINNFEVLLRELQRIR